MAVVRYSQRAEDDLYEIAIYTLEHWGVEQTDRYVASVENFCALIAGLPGIGRECDEIAKNLRRMEHESHVIFFFPTEEGILVSRIFHKSQDVTDAEFIEFGRDV